MEQTIQYKTQARLKRAFYFKFSKRKNKKHKNIQYIIFTQISILPKLKQLHHLKYHQNYPLIEISFK